MSLGVSPLLEWILELLSAGRGKNTHQQMMLGSVNCVLISALMVTRQLWCFRPCYIQPLTFGESYLFLLF